MDSTAVQVETKFGPNKAASTMKTITSSPKQGCPKVVSMRTLSQDSKPFEIFEDHAGNPDGGSLKMRVFEWNQGDLTGRDVILNNIDELNARERCSLRVIFAPLDVPHPKTIVGLMALFKEYKFPSSFVSERIQSVSQSFGSLNEDGTQCERTSIYKYTSRYMLLTTIQTPGSTSCAKILTSRPVLTDCRKSKTLPHPFARLTTRSLRSRKAKRILAGSNPATCFNHHSSRSPEIRGTTPVGAVAPPRQLCKPAMP